MDGMFSDCARNRVNMFLSLSSSLSHTHVCACEKKSQLQNTTKTDEKHVRAVKLTVHEQTFPVDPTHFPKELFKVSFSQYTDKWVTI